MKLNKEQIQFIDNYLENSDVYYADIRMEMVDHVCSAIENQMSDFRTDDFYMVFKNYMVLNKSLLLENNKKFLKSVNKRLFNQLIKVFIKPTCILVFTLIVIAVYYGIEVYGYYKFEDVINWFPVLSIVPFFFIYGISLRYFRISRFSGVERMAFFYMAFFQILNVSKIVFKGYLNSQSVNHLIISISLALMVVIGISLLWLTYVTINSYRLKFKSL